MSNYTLMILSMLFVGVALADDFEISRSTMDGGGVIFSTGGDFALSGTIGQPDAGVMAGGEFTLTGGFWFETPMGDCNSTGCVNLLDYDDFEFCLSGPDGALGESWCNCFDIDSDNDVDLTDLARFQRSFTGQ
jgi:hypothetical protein